MGITSFDIQLLEKALIHKADIKTVMELGSQNLYLNGEEKPPFANTWYEARGIKYSCIDLGGDNGAMPLDLAHAFRLEKDDSTVPGFKSDIKFDLVTDFGTSEHVVQMEKHTKVAFHDGHINSIYPDGVKDIERGYYNCWLNKHNLLKVGGIMVNVNPKTGHWPGHGYSYLRMAFYEQLCDVGGYKIIELGENAAMGNSIDGINVYCILEKVSEKFPHFEEFKTFAIHSS